MAKKQPDYKKTGSEIFKYIGTRENVKRVYNCMTRVRCELVDNTKVDIDALKKIEGVMGVVEDEETIQVVVGPGKSAKIAEAMAQDLESGKSEGDIAPKEETLEERAKRVKAEDKEKHRKNKGIQAALKAIGGVFIPLIPGFVGSGLLGGAKNIMSNMIAAGDVPAGSEPFTTIMNLLGLSYGAIFSYLVIYVGINAAKQFNCTPVIGGIIGAMTLLPGVSTDSPLKNIFTGGNLTSGQGGIIGVLFAVWVAGYVERFLRKFIPDSLDIIFTPTILLIIMSAFEIVLVMPLAGAVSGGLVGFINWVINMGGAVSGFILGTLFLPMVSVGLHQILTPIHIDLINNFGYTTLLPILAMAGAGQVGAAIALWIRGKKNNVLTTAIKGALPVGILGIGEPLIYGVTMPLGKPFITACLGGGVGGAVVAALGNVGAIAIGPSGIALIPLIAEGRWFAYVIGLLSGYLGGFLLTFFFGIPKNIDVAFTAEDK